MSTYQLKQNSLLQRKKQMIYLKKLPKKSMIYENLPLQRCSGQILIQLNNKNDINYSKQNKHIYSNQQHPNDNQSTAKNNLKNKQNTFIKKKILQKQTNKKILNCIDYQSSSLQRSLEYCCDIRNIDNKDNNEEINKKQCYIEDCCVRLFTFMGSTQKYKYSNNGQNRQNNKQEDISRQKQNQEQNLIHFIQNSRKKRQQFLNQLKNLQDNQKYSIYNNDNNNLLSRKKLKMISINSARNMQDFKLKNKAQSTKMIKSKTRTKSFYTPQNNNDKLNEKIAYFKANPNKKSFSTNRLIINDQPIRKRTLSQNRIKDKHFNKQNFGNSIQNTIIPNHLNSNITISRQKQKQLQSNIHRDSKDNKSKKSIKKYNFNIINKTMLSSSSLNNKKSLLPNTLQIRTSRDQSNNNKHTKQTINVNMQNLIKKKKQLQSQLMNINGQILMFNKKKKNKK